MGYFGWTMLGLGLVAPVGIALLVQFIRQCARNPRMLRETAEGIVCIAGLAGAVLLLIVGICFLIDLIPPAPVQK